MATSKRIAVGDYGINYDICAFNAVRHCGPIAQLDRATDF